MKTEFGKFISKLLIDKNQNLSDLSNVLGATVPFLSAVINGKKHIPDKWCQIICENYKLSQKDENLLIESIENSKQSMNIDLSECDLKKRQCALVFQRNLNSLSTDQIEKINKIIGEK